MQTSEQVAQNFIQAAVWLNSHHVRHDQHPQALAVAVETLAAHPLVAPLLPALAKVEPNGLEEWVRDESAQGMEPQLDLCAATVADWAESITREDDGEQAAGGEQ